MFDLDKITRENIKNLVPYSSARSEFTGQQGTFLDANENSNCPPFLLAKDLDMNINRYPDPLQIEIKDKLAKITNLSVSNIFLGNGSDEAIDILFRTFCKPNVDNVIICPPTYGMYEVSANINDVSVIKIPLTADEFQLDTENILRAINPETKLIFICCPNNPTGNGVRWTAIREILGNFNGIVVIDEAYINFAGYRSLLPELLNYPNLVILQTFSKAWGMAGLRVGMAFASERIIDLFNKVKPPYNINIASQKLVLNALNNTKLIGEWIELIIEERNKLSLELNTLPFVIKVYPSDANFLLVKVKDARSVYNFLISNNLIIRDRSKISLCENCVRITIGTREENQLLLSTLKQYV